MPHPDAAASIIHFLAVGYRREMLWTMARTLVERGAPLTEPPGSHSISTILRQIDPPSEGGSGTDDYALFAKAMADRGVPVPRQEKAKPGP